MNELNEGIDEKIVDLYDEIDITVSVFWVYFYAFEQFFKIRGHTSG